LRPLSLSDIFNGAVAYIRANPKATLGLTTIVVVAAQILALILSVGPLAVTGDLQPTLRGEEVSTGVLLGSSASSLAGAVATGLSSILLSGMLTVVVGRAVFGASITIGEAWQRLRPRLWALIGFTVLEVIGAVVLIALVVLIIVGVAVAANGVAASVIGVPLVLALIAGLIYLGTMLSFTPSILVLERLEMMLRQPIAREPVRRTDAQVIALDGEQPARPHPGIHHGRGELVRSGIEEASPKAIQHWPGPHLRT